MDFIKVLQIKKLGRAGSAESYLTISGKELNVFVKNGNCIIKQVGLVEGGVGIVLEEVKTNKKYNLTQARRTIEEGDIPANLQASGYKFRINGDKVSDTEFVFLFKNAVSFLSK